MAISAKLELRHSQQLVMTPQLQQAIRLLQLSNIELGQFVETELERNPLLERDEDKDGVPVTGEQREGDAANAAGSDEEWLDLAKPVEDPAGSLDTDFSNVYADAPAETPNSEAPGQAGLSDWSGVRQRANGFSGEEMDLDAMGSAELSLKDHLEAQLQLAIVDPVARVVGKHLIDLVDDAGYLNGDLERLADRLGAEVEFVERVLEELQTFDPPGVFARSLSECMALQLKDKNRYDPVIAALLDNLHLLAAHNLTGLKKAVDVDADELADMINEIKALNPKPGLQFGSVHVQTVVPDVLVRGARDGSWIVELNSDTLPRVLVNRSYYTCVSKTASKGADKDYIYDCLQTANWLVKSLDQRARTILRVAEEIVRQQDAFFTLGVQHLKPLNLKTVADAISMHESTVSRVTSNKYLSSPRGIFEMKYFFTSAIASSQDGEAHSSEAVRHRIRALIDGETAKSVLSDDKIVERLKIDGIDIARRTVAKYREAMRIPSSVQRRREKKLGEQMKRGA